MEIVTVMLKIIFAMGLGFFLFKIKILNEESNAVMSRLVSLAAAPCMIFSAVISLDGGKKQAIVLLLVEGIVLYVILGALSFIVAKLLRPGKGLQGVYEAVMTFGNSAFIGFPVGQALMGDIGVSYLAVLNIHQNIFAWSYGIFQLTKGNGGKAVFSLKKLLNPPIIVSIVALILYFANVRIPDIVMSPINFVGQICSPLSMVIVGATIATYPFKSLFTKPKHYVISLCKLIVFPLIIFGLCYLALGMNDITKAITIHTMMPTAVIICMIAIIYDADYKTTSSITGLMDILCIGTIPAVWTIITLFG